jgi:membrane protease YdiL (CAAX protease family)
METSQTSGARAWMMIAGVGAATILLWRLGMTAHAATPPVFPRADHLTFALILTAGAIALVGLALRIEGASMRSIGLGGLVRGLGLGAAWWLIPAGVGLGVAIALGWGQVTLMAAPSDALLKFAGLIALVFLAEALPEELIFRGYIQSCLSGLVGAWGGVLIQAVLFTGFAVLIGAAADPMQIGFIAAFGVALGVLRAATGSLWAPIGFHLVFMVAQQSYGGGWDLIVLTLPEMTRMLLLAQMPFALVIALLFSRVGGKARA